LCPGVVTTERVQAEIVAELQRQKVRYVVLLAVPAKEPNESSRGSGVTLLDRFINEYYERVAAYGRYSILTRRPDRWFAAVK
jgi:hypothetical protein